MAAVNTTKIFIPAEKINNCLALLSIRCVPNLCKWFQSRTIWMHFEAFNNNVSGISIDKSRKNNEGDSDPTCLWECKRELKDSWSSNDTTNAQKNENVSWNSKETNTSYKFIITQYYTALLKTKLRHVPPPPPRQSRHRLRLPCPFQKSLPDWRGYQKSLSEATVDIL